MTLRMDWICMALAASVLMISDITAAHALTFCDIYPNRCQYTPSGKGYYYPLGYRLPSEGARASSGGAMAAAWGCIATDGHARGRSWGYPNRLAASYGALSGCTKLAPHCRIVSCSASIHSQYEAHATFDSLRR